MSERLQIQKANKSTTDTSVHNSSKILYKNRKPLASQPPLIQTKLAINQPGDQYEQEADRMTDRVMQMQGPVLQRKYSQYDEDGKKTLQTKELQGQLPLTQVQDLPPLVHEVLRSPGQPLDQATRVFMEPRFGHNFSNVRVHYGEIAEQSAKDVNAHAYTVGPNIVFGVGQYAPETQAGRRLLAHELTHVVQQTGADGVHTDQVNEKSNQPPLTPPSVLVTDRPANNISKLPFTHIQREEASTDDNKPRDESLGLKESIVIDSLAAGATPGMPLLKPIIKGGFTGFYIEVRHQIREGKGQQFMDRVKELLVSPGDMIAFGKGYYWGILQGLWSPVQGIIDIVKLAWKIQQWQLQSVANVIQNIHEITTMQGSLIDRFSKLGDKAKTFFEGIKKNATDFVGRLIGAISGGVFELAKTGGSKAGKAIFNFLNKPWGEIGEGVGTVVGTVLVEVGMALFSGGIGNALTKVGQALDKVAPTLMKGVRFIASELGAIIAEIRALVETIKADLAKAGRSLLKGFEDFIGEVGSIFDDLIAMLKKLFSSAEDAAAKLPIDVPLPVKKPVPHISAPRPPVAAKPPHVEPVPAKKPHTESLVPKESNVEVGAPKKPQVEMAPPKEPPIAKPQTDAVKFVNDNPKVIKGEPGHRSASVGGGHEIVEVPEPSLPSGIACELHSSTSVKVPCPKGMGTKGTKTGKDLSAGAKTKAAEKELVGEGFVEGPAKAIRPGRAPRTGFGKAARGEFEKVRDSYAKRLGVPSYGQVHHAIELQVLDRYPGVYTSRELNAFKNMRGIGTEDLRRTQLHNSKVREIWDRHYARMDKEIKAAGLKPGTAKYNEYVRRNLEASRDEIDYVLGQFFTEYRTGKPRSFK